MSIEAWVTDPAETYLATLDRSEASPFRAFAVSHVLNEPGAGSLEHHLTNALLAANPDLLADGNLVWMKYRGKTGVWVIEERKVVLDEREHATDWVQVSGRGALQLLDDRIVLPPAFASGANLNPATWGADNQWRRFVNRAAGEMLWDLISELNAFIVARGGAALVRGTVETTGADGWTQDLRFDNLLDVVAAVTAAYGDVYMDGLTFNYVNALGIDRSGSVILEEGADLTRVERSSRDRDTVSWIVGEGLGEGVFAKLAVAEDATTRRPRMAYLDAKDANNVPLLGVLTNAALAENRPFESTGFEFTEERYRAFEDFDVGDTIRAIAPSRNVDASARIVALYVAEKDDEVVVACDLTSPRPDPLLGLDERQRSTARSLGVRSRQPQGQLVPFSFSGQGVFDTDDTLEVHLFIPDRMYVTIEARVAIDFRPFFSSSKSASSGGAATSGPSSASSSSNGSANFGLGSNPTSGTSGAASAGTAHTHGAGTYNDPNAVQTDGGHTHPIQHTHTTPDHTHGLTYGVFKESYPASHSVTLKVYELVGSTWTLRTTITGLTDDQEDEDLSAIITGPGKWRLDLVSAAAQPNGGRLGAYVSGFVLGAIKSA